MGKTNDPGCTMTAVSSGMAEFLHMGGYAAYVWPAYGIVALVLVAQIWQVRRQFRQVWAQLASQNRVLKDNETAS